MIKRKVRSKLVKYAKTYSIVTLTGPRQSGKTTLCKQTFPKKPYVSLENSDQRDFAIKDPRAFLAQYPDGAILDEIQRTPDLPSYIQGIVDDNKSKKGLFILTGSQNFSLIQSVNQSLAGRTALLTLLPFDFSEVSNFVAKKSLEEILITGFYPRIHDENLIPQEAYQFYLKTYVERDLRQLSQIHDLLLFETFLKLCVGRIGQILNLNSLANDVGISHTTAKQWLSILEASYIVYRLPPYFGNFNKRLIKSPKLYFYDVGLASYLAKIENPKQMFRDPLKGNLFENLIINEFIKNRYNQGKEPDFCFYRDSNGNEIDLLYQAQGLFNCVEIKAGQTISNSYFKTIEKFQKIIQKKHNQSFLIYGGDENQNRTIAKVVGFKKLKQVLDSK